MSVNLVLNGSFEDNFTHWSRSGNTEIVDTERLDGSKSLKITGTGSVFKSSAGEQFKTFSGDTWAFSAWVKNGSFTGQGGIKLQKLVDGQWSDAASSNVTSAHGSAWEKHNLNYTATQGVSGIRVAVSFTGTGDIYVDDLQLYNNIESLEHPVQEGDNDHPRYHVSVHKAIKDVKGVVLSLDPSMNTSSNQTIGGIKTFSQTRLQGSPTVPGQVISRKYANDTISPKQDAFEGEGSGFYFAGDKTFKPLNKTSIGLDDVDNTSDPNKPISIAAQEALDKKADYSQVSKVGEPHVIGGTKTITVPPKMPVGAVPGYVWTATDTLGLGQWADPNSVSWDDIDIPDTFPPTIGNTGSTAAAGNHTHSKASIGLGNVDNVSDEDKPISNAEQTALNGKVPNSRTISTSSPLIGGGDLSSNRTIAIASQSVGVELLNREAREEGICFYQTLGKRAVGHGQVPEGIRIGFPCVLTSIRYRGRTADGSGNSTVEIRKNGVALAGSSGAVSFPNGTNISGSWSFAEGDILSVYVSSVGTNPGNVLIADMVVYKV